MYYLVHEKNKTIVELWDGTEVKYIFRRVFPDDLEFSPDDIDHPATMQSQTVFDVVDSTERCESSVVNQEEPLIDWSLIEIAPPISDDSMCDPLGINDVDIPITEENMCDLLGINDEAVPEPPPSPPREEVYMAEEEERQLFIEAAIPMDDSVPPDEEIAYDKENPQMYLGALFPSMKDFRMAIRQYAIKREIDIWGYKTDKKRYLGKCRAKGCPWRITARIRTDGQSIRVLTFYLSIVIVAVFLCFS